MKVAILSPTIDVTNGWGNYTYELCKNLKDKIDFTLFLPKKYKFSEKIGFPIKCILPNFVSEFRQRNTPEPFLNPEIDLDGFDIIHSLVSFPYGILANSLSKVKKIPYLITAHGTYAVKPLFYKPDRNFLARSYLKASSVITPSRFTSKMIEKFAKVKANIEVLPHAVNFNRFQTDYDVSEIGKEYEGKRIILNIGELKPRKGQDIIIKSINVVKRYFTNVKYLFIGKDGWDGFLQSLVSKFKLEKDVVFLGEMRGENLIKYYKLCDIFVHTPRLINWKFEGFGIVYLEAGACGKPVIGSKSGGVPDAVIDGTTGILVPENNPKATSYAILKLLKDKPLAKKLGENGKERAKELNWENYVEKLLNIYSDCLMGKESRKKF